MARLIAILLASLFVVGTAAQSLPDCAQTCAESAASQVNCNLSDTACLCNAPGFKSATDSCIDRSCSHSDDEAAEHLFKNLCTGSSVTLAPAPSSSGQGPSVTPAPSPTPNPSGSSTSEDRTFSGSSSDSDRPFSGSSSEDRPFSSSTSDDRFSTPLASSAAPSPPPPPAPSPPAPSPPSSLSAPGFGLSNGAAVPGQQTSTIFLVGIGAAIVIFT
ncbi:hypothetical protein BC834DRAFT_884231 [Gloeopeniophorella convolvens]|nr:hypothetical protein BC834DRAFT_884231 [Gloeopeniophorella convolvens]